jgi:hypothetical protein
MKNRIGTSDQTFTRVDHQVGTEHAGDGPGCSCQRLGIPVETMRNTPFTSTFSLSTLLRRLPVGCGERPLGSLPATALGGGEAGDAGTYCAVFTS